jgi:GLPGLI family protein
MKKFILAALFLTLRFNGIAQTYTITYSDGALINPEKLKELPYELQQRALLKKLYTLTISNNISEYRMSANTEPDPVTATMATERITYQNEEYYYKDLTQNTMLFETGSGKTLYHVADNLLPWNWKILPETRIIAGYTCRKATSTLKGITFTAWFTKDLPTATGPQKYDGLPGVILAAGNANREIVAETVTISKATTAIVKPVFKDKTITFMEMIADVEKNIKGINEAAGKPVTTTKPGGVIETSHTEVYKY